MSAIDGVLTQVSNTVGLPKWAVAASAGIVGLGVARFAAGLAFPPKKLQKGDGLKVVVTGCDTGFGNLTAIALSERGFTVFAACLTDKGMQSLKELSVSDTKYSTLKPFKMDVTKEEDVKACRALIEQNCPEGLYCLVNNAGLHAAYRWELSPMDLIQKDMDVNYFGAVRVGLALAPLLRKFAKTNKAGIFAGSKPAARLVIVTSSAGFYPSMPYGPYAASKHAARVFAITLRQELKPFGVLVSSVEPFFAKTPFLTDVDERKISRVLAQPAEIIEAYGGATDIRKRMARSGFNTAVPSDLLEPETVVSNLVQQVSLFVPDPHCVVGKTAKALNVIAPLLPSSSIDKIAWDFEMTGL